MLATLQKTITAQTAVLIANPHHIQYLTGFESLAPGEREAFLLVQEHKTTLLYASFSPVEKLPEITYVPTCSIAAVLEQITTNMPLAVDMQTITAAEYIQLQQSAHTLSNWDEQTIWQLRMRKNEQELAMINEAVEITKQVLENALQTLQPGMSELDVRRSIDAQLFLAGADATAFPSIVAFDEHSALPHHQPTDKTLANNTAVLIDCGAKVRGYCADMTRTIWFGTTPDPEFVKIKTVVEKAFAAAQTATKQKKPTAKSIDDAARSVIVKSGYGPQFIHTTGHGLGLSIHEPPSLNTRSEQVLEPGMVFTIEPGIYLPGKFGVRWEETKIF